MKALVTDLTKAMPEERHASLLHYRERLDGTIAHAFSSTEEQAEASAEDRQGLGAPR